MRNLLIFKFSQRLITCLVNGGHAGTVNNIIEEIGREALLIQLKELRKNKMYVAQEGGHLAEQFDARGQSRFRLGISEEGACMVPDSLGYWTRALHIGMQATRKCSG